MNQPRPQLSTRDLTAATSASQANEAKRQTASFLSKRLTAAGLKPVSRYGQNFLVDLNLVELIARSAELTRRDVVLEIGTGVGSLTAIMADQAGAIVTVEIDQNLFALASDELAEHPNVKLIRGDALKNKNTFRPDLLPLVEEALARLSQSPYPDVDPELPPRFMLVANLPYNVATPIVSNLLRRSPTPDRIVVTIQKELADRMTAKPSTKDYGALSVWVQALCEVEIVRVLPPTVFWPRPKVESAIVKLDVIPERRAAFADLEYFHQTVRALFFHRRKFLRRVVMSAMKGRLDKAQVDDVLRQCGRNENERAEQLDLNQITALVEALRQQELAV
ncbi:MAG: 16S rRNA (adenine(1518)-N(6)/adenine(1519)-N(6))-dimethyltransferase RsmA [Planctomycetota bacterium]